MKRRKDTYTRVRAWSRTMHNGKRDQQGFLSGTGKRRYAVEEEKVIEGVSGQRKGVCYA